VVPKNAIFSATPVILHALQSHALVTPMSKRPQEQSTNMMLTSLTIIQSKTAVRFKSLVWIKRLATDSSSPQFIQHTSFILFGEKME
jgi:hypothetical protein